MYLDNAKPDPWVTCGVGCKVDDGTPGPTLGLPWVHKAGGPASRDEIAAAWHRVKAAVSMASLGGGHFAGLTDLRLEDADIDALMFARWEPMEVLLRYGFGRGDLGGDPSRASGAWDAFPAAAQLALADMTFNMGPGRLVPGPTYEFPHLRAAVLRGDWADAALNCQIKGAPADRNAAHAALFTFAAGHDPDALPT